MQYQAPAFIFGITQKKTSRNVRAILTHEQQAHSRHVGGMSRHAISSQDTPLGSCHEGDDAILCAMIWVNPLYSPNPRL